MADKAPLSVIQHRDFALVFNSTVEAIVSLFLWYSVTVFFSSTHGCQLRTHGVIWVPLSCSKLLTKHDINMQVGEC